MQIVLKNKTALITGATGKLGKVIASTLARCGADVILAYYRNEQEVQKLKECVESMDRRVYVVKVDLTSDRDVQNMYDELKKAALPDIIICNAVSQFPWKSVLEQPIEHYLEQFQISALQSVRLAKLFLPAMKKKKWGRFIGINTECTIQCHSTQSAYIAGKRAMDGILRVLAKEAGVDQVTVNQIAPGWIQCEGESRQEAYEAKVPLGRRACEQDVANVAAFLSSDLANFITGTFIPVTGGNVMTSA